MKFTKKPVTIDAVLWDGKNVKEVMDFMAWRNASHDEALGLRIHTLEGTLSANVGDWIIKGVKGEFYACKPDIFAMTYDPAAPAACNGDALPPLPEAHLKRGEGWTPHFTKKQMRSYAKAAIAADRAARAGTGSAGSAHPDDLAVDRFAEALKIEMSAQREKGRGGWDDQAQCHTQDLAASMIRQIDNGEIIKVGTYAMMLFNRKCWSQDLVGAMSSHFQDARRCTGSDAYMGAREDMEIWKRRALEAEEACRKMTAALNAENGPTFMGEPDTRATKVEAAPGNAGEGEA